MTQRFRDEDATLIRFGGGRNTRASEDSISDLECSEGENFLLNPGNAEFKPREPFNLLGTAPNGGRINGFVTLQETDGTVTMLVQAGTAVYKWDGADFLQVGTVAAGARLRGTTEAFWALADKVLISDIALAEPISSWNGTAFQNETFLASDGSTPFGPFRCKYIVIENERAFFGNIHDNGTLFPHLLVGSERGDFLVVSTGARPSSGASVEDPFFLPMPQLRAINGMASSFGVLALSQKDGAFEQLLGSDATDFKLDKLHRGSGARGDESMVPVGNDVIYGAEGRIESLESTDKYGDVERDDVSFKIANDIEDVTEWTLVYNDRLKRLYCFPNGEEFVHVAFTEFINSQLSSWSKYTTQHAFGFSQTAVMTCVDPVDGLRYVYMGDLNGNLYRMEGTAGGGDGGSAEVKSRRVSKLSASKLNANTFNAAGWVQYRKRTDVTVSLKFIFAGEHVYDVEKQVELPGVVFDTVYNGSAYYGGQFYYGARNEDRLIRSTFGVPHFANQWQVEARIESVNDFDLTEIGIRFDLAG